jgi:hypothetical protein
VTRARIAGSQTKQERKTMRKKLRIDGFSMVLRARAAELIAGRLQRSGVDVAAGVFGQACWRLSLSIGV